MEDTSKKFVMILEKSSHNLSVETDGDDVVLEGIFAEFGTVNNNDRIYEEAEYLPHMEYLNKKIEGKRLLGELDHPEKFDISLSKVSHVIEKLEYLKESRQIKGRVRLLNTPSGRIAKELIKGGIPISISSRAAGVVESNKKVKIKKIFTYDLVADPGFENAVLNRINESLGIHNDLISVFEVDDDMMKNFLEEENENTQKTNEHMDFVTPQELHDYSLIVKKEIENINENVDSINGDKLKTITESVVKIEKYMKYLSEVSDKTIQYVEYVGEQLEAVSTSVDKNIAYTEYVAEKATQGISYMEYLGEKVDQTISYAESIAETTDQGIEYAEYIKEQMVKHIAYTNYLAENIDSQLSYAEYLAEKLDQGIAYTEHIAEKASQGIDYAEYVAEQLETSISRQDQLDEQLKKGISYTEYVAEQTQAVADYAEYAMNESATNKSQEIITEATLPAIDYSSLSSQVDKLLESVKKQKTDELNESMTHGKVRLPDESLIYGFVNLLNESKREEFRNLDDAKKQKVASALNGKTLVTETEVLNLWESALHPRAEKWIEEAPEKYKTLWESLDESQKRTLASQSRTYKLESDYQIKNFWETRSASLLTSKSNSLNESTTEVKLQIPSLGYSDDYLKKIESQLSKYKR